MKFATLTVLVVTCVSANAYAEQIECVDPVDNKAVIGFAPGTDVIHYENPDEMTCRFSVDGWSAGSPPREEGYLR